MMMMMIRRRRRMMIDQYSFPATNGDAKGYSLLWKHTAFVAGKSLQHLWMPYR
jgi:hypothetical protein